MSLEEMLDVWKEVRAGLIAELAQIPAEQFGFQATSESRSVAGIIRHIIDTQKFLTDKMCRPDTDFKRLPKGKTMSKLGLLYLYIGHEMWHRGQISVYERLMQIEPALTAKLRESLASDV